MTTRTAETSSTATKKVAQQAGALYLLFAIMAIVNEFFIPSFTVPGDATATAAHIIAAELTFRIGILSGFVTHILFIFLVVSLYHLLKEVDKRQAMLMVLFVALGVTIALVNILNKLAPLVFLSGGDYLSVFTKPQLDALALSFLRLHSAGVNLTTAFWGLWLFPFGILVIKSRFFPKILGILLMLAGFAYLTMSVTSIVLPAYRPVVAGFMMPLYLGELPIIPWLLFKGAKVPLLESKLYPAS